VNDLVIYSCRTGEDFAKRVAQKIKAKLSKNERTNFSLGKEEVFNFASGEISVKLGSSVRGKSVHLFQSFTQDGTPSFHTEIWELGLILNALKLARAEEVTVYCPFLPYMRQDRKAEGRESISAKHFFEFIEMSAGSILAGIVTADIHNKAEEGFASVPLDHLTALPLFVLFIKQNLGKKELVVVSPDAGSVVKAKRLANLLGVDYAIVEKSRSKGKDAQTGYLIGNVKNKTAVIFDDMIDSGGSLVAAAELLLSEGANKTIYAFATHGIFSPKNGQRAEDKLKNAGIQVIITDSVPRAHSYYKENKAWLEVVSLSKYFADAVWCNHTHQSLGKTLDRHLERAIKRKSEIKDYIIKT